MVALIVIRTATDWLTIAASASGGRIAGSSHRTGFIVARHSAGLWVPIFDRTKSYVSSAHQGLSHLFIITGRRYADFGKEKCFLEELSV